MGCIVTGYKCNKCHSDLPGGVYAFRDEKGPLCGACWTAKQYEKFINNHSSYKRKRRVATER